MSVAVGAQSLGACFPASRTKPPTAACTSSTEVNDAHRPHMTQVIFRRKKQSDLGSRHVDQRLCKRTAPAWQVPMSRQLLRAAVKSTALGAAESCMGSSTGGPSAPLLHRKGRAGWRHQLVVGMQRRMNAMMAAPVRN